MKLFKVILTIAFLSLLFVQVIYGEDWGLNCPFKGEIGQNAFISTEYLHLYVPKSFEGRTAKEHRVVKGAEAFGVGRFSRIESRVQLHGKVSVFDYDYTSDNLDIQIFESKNLRPGSNSCMDCHGGKFHRTSVVVGETHKEILPKPVKRGNITFTIDPAYTEEFHAGVSHWLSYNLMARGDYRWGYVRQGRYNLTAKATTVGLSGLIRHRANWSGDFIFSKTETYKQRKTFVGKLSYRLGKGLILGVSGGIFFDGYTHFGTEMSEMGIISTTLEKDDPGMMPSLFNKLKEDKFGYLHYSVGYEYRF